MKNIIAYLLLLLSLTLNGQENLKYINVPNDTLEIRIPSGTYDFRLFEGVLDAAGAEVRMGSLRVGDSTASLIYSGIIPDIDFVLRAISDSLAALSIKDSTHVTTTDTLKAKNDTSIILGSPLSVPFYTENFASSKTVNYSDGNSQKRILTVTGDMTINFTGIEEGVVYTIHLYQDGTGGHTITLGTFNGGTATAIDNTGTISTDASDLSKLQIEYDGTNIIYGILTTAL